MSIILDKTLEVLVWATSLKHDLNIVLVFSKIGRVLLHGNHSAGLLERITGVALWIIKCNTFNLVESLCEVICINNTENSTVNIEVGSNIQISPGVDLGLLTGDENLVSLEENSLRDTAILNSIFEDMKSIIIEIVINSAFTDTIILGGVLNNGLLEVCLEVQDLRKCR